MSAKASYTALLDHVRRAALLSATARVLIWDQETQMPTGGSGAPSVEYRSRQLSQLAGMIHELESDRRIESWLGECRADADLFGDADSPAAVNLREIRRAFTRASKLPTSLVQQLAEAKSLAKHVWAKAKQSADFETFRPHLERIVRLCRAKAECWGHEPGGELWDALAEDHEPGMNARQIDELFKPLRTELFELIGQISMRRRPADELRGLRLPVSGQKRFATTIASRIGFDFARGRADDSPHPFCLPLHRNDVRITCRFRESDFLDGLGATLHEAGHGLYNQNLPGGEHVDTPMGEPLRFAIHESQARLIENQIGRCEAFWRWCAPLVREGFGHSVRSVSDRDFFVAANSVRRSLIRTEADELTYNVHIMIRFELERSLIRGDLSTADVPQAWGALYARDLNIEPPDDASGCLQDIHWAQGAIGYFPTYTLGNLYAAQFYEAMERELGGLDEIVSSGEFIPIVEWLVSQVHRHGSRYSAERLCRDITGSAMNAGPFIRYVRKKFAAVYDTA